MTLRERYLAVLAAAGLKPAPRQTSKKYVTVPIADGRNIYLGKAGAFRLGRTVADSFAAVLRGQVPKHWITGEKRKDGK